MTTFPTHPAFETFRRERAATDDSYHADFYANNAVHHEHGFRFGTEARFAIETAPAIASEPGRMGDALRLIATAFDAIPGHLVEQIPAPSYRPVCECSKLDPRAAEGGAVCDSCHDENQAAMIAAEERSERIYASSYGLGL